MISNVVISGENVPPELQGFRIAQISDLHNAEFGENNERLCSMLADAKPSMIAITGDIIDGTRTDTDTALRFAEEAVKIAPTYYVSGNHEAAMTDYAVLRDGLKKLGAVVLEDETATLKVGDAEITIVGLSDPNFTLKGDLFGEAPSMTGKKLAALTENNGTYKILLSHRPELFETYVKSGINLTLSGHAHGGQIRLPFIGGLAAPDQGIFPKYDAGLFTDGNSKMVVSRGLGNSIIPLRFNNRPEVVLIDFTAQAN